MSVLTFGMGSATMLFFACRTLRRFLARLVSVHEDKRFNAVSGRA